MNCPRCQSNDIDSYGVCLLCGFEIPQWKNEFTREPQTIVSKEPEEKEPDFQNIIDTAVSSKAVVIPESEEPAAVSETADLFFREMREKDDAIADMIVTINDGTADDVADTTDAGFETADADDDTADGIYVYNSAYFDDAAQDVHAEDADARAVSETAAEIVYLHDSGKFSAAYNDEDIAAADMPAAADTEQVTYSEDVPSAESIEYDANDYTLDMLNEETIERITSSQNKADSDSEGRLIFLSRTLSGLIDLLLVVLFSGVFLGMADYFTEAPMLHSMTAINFSTLFLLIYFLYSIFFIATNKQTIGMMATDLCIVGMDKKSISMSQVVRRNSTFLVSLFGLGIGLLTGVFSRKCLCMHDRLSETRVVRIIRE